MNNQPLKLVYEIMTSLFSNAIEIYRNYFQKITYVRKHLINKYPLRIYKSFLQFIEVKYKERNFSLDQLLKYYDKLITKKNINSERNSFLSNADFVKKSSLESSMSNSLSKNSPSILETSTWKHSFRKKIK
jgi:hypothetical protein